MKRINSNFRVDRVEAGYPEYVSEGEENYAVLYHRRNW